MKAFAPGEMKLSGTGLMPLVVLWEWKGEESGRGREVRGERQRQKQPQRHTGRLEEKVMLEHPGVWQTWWQQGLGGSSRGKRGHTALNRESPSLSHLQFISCGIFKFLSTATPPSLFWILFQPSSLLSLSISHLPLYSVVVLLFLPPPLDLPFCFSHPPTLPLNIVPSPPSPLQPPQDFMILFNDKWAALDSIFLTARNLSFSESLNLILFRPVYMQCTVCVCLQCSGWM